MKRVLGCLSIVACLLVASTWTLPAAAEEAKPSRALVSIYQVAAGKHLDFLKWMARQQALTKEAGGAVAQWYLHQDGASWDFVAITPQLEASKQAEVDRKMDALARQKGLATGIKASFEFRQYMGNHSDTFALGPVAVEDLLKMAEK